MFIISLTFMSLLLKVQCRTFDYAVLAADSSTQSEEFCLYVEPTISFPKQKSESKSYILRNNEEVNWCIDSNKTNCVNEVLLLPADNCSISTQVDNFLHMSGEVIVFVSEDPLDPLDFEETKYLNKTGIPTVKISEHSAKMLKEMGRTVRIKLFKPDGLGLGYFYPILWLLSVFAVVLISHWSGFNIYKRLEQELHLKPFNIFKDKEYIILFLRIVVYVLMLVVYSLHVSYHFKATILDVLSIMSSSMPLFLCLDFLTGSLKHYLKKWLLHEFRNQWNSLTCNWVKILKN
ncbi:signal peptide peptidase-like 2B [Trichonephila clavata]|uniref:Signal peptide peptidase-like 2B n=1 Tax=Trichonephila clavata TaxID=2740835 RepID=A0A8X6LRB4_TRICU|nr:signal peptide peptidase-like 2B [Trichonephila clavata]